MDIREIINYLGRDWDSVKERMKTALDTDVSLLEDINLLFLSNSGKGLRPMTALLTAMSTGKVTADTISLAAAVELLHNATLFHDDVADDSSLRRGKPTIYSQYGPSTAVLVGDYWLSKSVALILGTSCSSRVIPLFAKTMSCLSEGEMLQLQKARTADTTEDDYFRIIKGKTSALFAVVTRTAAISAGASQQMVESAGRFGEVLGEAFQVRDDILDYCGSDEMGKPSGIDLKEQKITLPLLGAFRNRPELEREMRSRLVQINEHPEYCTEIREFVVQNGGIEYSRQVLERLVDEAEQMLSCFRDTKSTEYLSQIVRYNCFRDR